MKPTLTANSWISTVESKNYPNLVWFGLREISDHKKVFFYRDGVPQETSVGRSQGAMVECLVAGQMGYSATSDLSRDGLNAALNRAYSQAKSAAQFSLYSFDERVRPAHQGRYESPVQNHFATLDTTQIHDTLARICTKLKVSQEIIRTIAFFYFTERDMRWTSSNGADIHQRFSFGTVDFEATAKKDSIIQKRTFGGLRGNSKQGGLELWMTPTLWEDVELVGQQAIELVNADECPSGALDLLLMPDQMMLQIHESIGHPLEMDRILGDERNYAGWSFVQKEDFGKLQYGSSLLNVSFDPTIQEEYASYGFDDIGVPATKEMLIEGGVLKRGLTGLESQIRTGQPGVSNQRVSNWNRPAIDRMANLNVEAGTTPLEQMISEMKDGVIMESNRSWSTDDYRRKFQFGCEYGRRVQNGKITGVVRNPNYRGTTVPFWTALKRVGDQKTFRVYGTPNCGKGEPNQSVKVGHASPACLFDGIEVFGGGK